MAIRLDDLVVGGDAALEQIEANLSEGDGVDISTADDTDTLDKQEILEIITQEMAQTSTGNYGNTIDTDREEALEYYLGNPRGDEIEGRSQVISTDVADAIEWIMPQVIKALVARGPVVTFDAISQEDEDQAQIETEYTHEVFMKDNEGYLNLYEFIKDALLYKNGVFKIYYDTTDETRVEKYDGLNEQELQMLLAQPDVELMQMQRVPDQVAMQERQQQMQGLQQQLAQTPPEQQQQLQMQYQQLANQPAPQLISCTVSITKTQGKVKVECVPPEEIRITQNHDSLSLENARFVAHTRLLTRSELLEAGYDPEIIRQASDNIENSYLREHKFEAQGEESIDYTSSDDSQTLLEISECYLSMDVDGSGIAQKVQVTVLGSGDPTEILDITPCDTMPFVASSAIAMPHKYHGLSIFDRLKQLQDQKTGLWRNVMDNLYLQNNREKEVVEGQVNIDDLLISRPGGIKRVKAPGMIRELQVQPIGQEGFQMLDYLDSVRTGRVGVSPDTAGVSDALGSAVGSEGVQTIMSAKEELTGLMVRTIAETGLKQAYVKIRDLLVRYQNSEIGFKFRGDWTKVNPSQWGKRSRTSVQVGTGTGDDSRKVNAIQQVIAYQAQAIQHPANTLVHQQQLFASLDEFCRSAGLSGADPYFLDPRSSAGQGKEAELKQSQEQQKQMNEQLQAKMAQAQAELGKAELMKGQAALTAQQAKTQADQSKLQLEGFKQQSDNEKKGLELQLDQAKLQLDTLNESKKQEFDYTKLMYDQALELTKLEHASEQEADENYLANKKLDSDIAKQNEENKDTVTDNGD